MTSRQLGIVVIAGMGFWLVVHAVASLGSAAYLALQASPSDSGYVMSELVTSSLADAVFNGIGGAVLIRLREPLSRRLFPGDPPIALPTEVDFVGGLFAVLGVYFVSPQSSMQPLPRSSIGSRNGSRQESTVGRTSPPIFVRLRPGMT